MNMGLEGWSLSLSDGTAHAGIRLPGYREERSFRGKSRGRGAGFAAPAVAHTCTPCSECETRHVNTAMALPPSIWTFFWDLRLGAYGYCTPRPEFWIYKTYRPGTRLLEKPENKRGYDSRCFCPVSPGLLQPAKLPLGL